MDLVRSGLPRDVEAGGERFLFRPPSVDEALSLFALLPGALAGDEDDRRQFNHVLAQWLPDTLFRKLTHPAARPQDVAADVLSLVNKGLPKSDTESEPISFDELLSMPWDLIVVDISQTYNAWIEDVLRMPWPRFVLLNTRLSAADARYTLRRLLLHLLPHTTRTDEILDDLHRRALYETEEKTLDDLREETADPELQEKINALDIAIGQARLRMAHPPRGKTKTQLRQEYSKLVHERATLLRKQK